MDADGSPWWLYALNFLPYVLLVFFIVIIIKHQGKRGWARMATEKSAESGERMARCLEKQNEVSEAMLIEFKAIRGLLEEIKNKQT
jgi:hypothetical protein